MNKNKIVTFSITLTALTLAYYLVIYTPKHNEQVKLNSIRQACVQQYNQLFENMLKKENKALESCEYTGICNHDGLIAYSIRQNGKMESEWHTYDWKSPVYRDNYINNCITLRK